MSDDAFALLGLDRGASAEDVHAARRRLAKELHPDRAGGDAAKMTAVNAAAEAALSALGVPASAASGGDDDRRGTTTSRPRRSGAAAGTGWSRRVASDVASFTIEALPADAFEALLVVTSWIGEVLVGDPPDVLEAHLYEPTECWCRLDIVPDAGACTVSLTVALPDSAGPGTLPDVDAVRDVWVANLNQLDWDRVGRVQRPPS